jgi:hypothetical protein
MPVIELIAPRSISVFAAAGAGAGVEIRQLNKTNDTITNKSFFIVFPPSIWKCISWKPILAKVLILSSFFGKSLYPYFDLVVSLIRKKKGGNFYYDIVESARGNGKSRSRKNPELRKTYGKRKLKE